jgi:hypothetical protein
LYSYLAKLRTNSSLEEPDRSLCFTLPTDTSSDTACCMIQHVGSYNRNPANLLGIRHTRRTGSSVQVGTPIFNKTAPDSARTKTANCMLVVKRRSEFRRSAFSHRTASSVQVLVGRTPIFNKAAPDSARTKIANCMVIVKRKRTHQCHFSQES